MSTVVGRETATRSAPRRRLVARELAYLMLTRRESYTVHHLQLAATHLHSICQSATATDRHRTLHASFPKIRSRNEPERAERGLRNLPMKAGISSHSHVSRVT